jgi:hypothetical protein
VGVLFNPEPRQATTRVAPNLLASFRLFTSRLIANRNDAFRSNFFGNLNAQLTGLFFDDPMAIQCHQLLFPHADFRSQFPQMLKTQTTQACAWTYTRTLDIHLSIPDWGAHSLQVQGQLATGPWSEMKTDTFTVLRPHLAPSAPRIPKIFWHRVAVSA